MICNIDYSLKEAARFQPFKLMEKILRQGKHLSGEENTFKLQIQNKMAQLYRLCDDICKKKSLLESDVYDHFHELRSHIDICREEAKIRIDNLCLDMIESSKKCEAQFMEYLRQAARQVLVPSGDDVLEKERKNLEETFRDPQLVIERLDALKRKHDAEIAQLKAKLNEFKTVGELLKLNTFESNASLSKNVCGRLNLFAMSNLGSNNKSRILTVRQWIDLMKTCEFSLDDKWSLVYRASEDGFGSSEFHARCDGKLDTLTIVKVDGASKIFGAFSGASWDSNFRFKEDARAFIFSLVNRDKRPVKMKITEPQYAICCCLNYGPTFGARDIYIASDANANSKSWFNLGSSYAHPQYEFKSAQAQSFLAGSAYFKVSDIEVYSRN